MTDILELKFRRDDADTPSLKWENVITEMPGPFPFESYFAFLMVN